MKRGNLKQTTQEKKKFEKDTSNQQTSQTKRDNEQSEQ